MRINEDQENLTNYIIALYRLGQNDLLDTESGIAIVQYVAKLYASKGIASVIGGLYVIIGKEYRSSHLLDDEEFLFAQELHDTWEERKLDDPWLYDQALKFTNSALNNDGMTAALVWQTVINEDSSAEQDTAYIFRLLEDGQELIHHFDLTAGD